MHGISAVIDADIFFFLLLLLQFKISDMHWNCCVLFYASYNLWSAFFISILCWIHNTKKCIIILWSVWQIYRTLTFILALFNYNVVMAVLDTHTHSLSLTRPKLFLTCTNRIPIDFPLFQFRTVVKLNNRLLWRMCSFIGLSMDLNLLVTNCWCCCCGHFLSKEMITNQSHSFGFLHRSFVHRSIRGQTATVQPTMLENQS